MNHSHVEYRYTGARAMVDLHEKYLRSFLAVWKRARAAEIDLPVSEDPAYASLDSLLVHVLGCARGYMVWMCERLALPDPNIQTTPEPADAATNADAFVEHLVERWRLPLLQVPEEAFYRPEYESRWGVLYCIDAMLEHAVMHVLRHGNQLELLLSE